MKKVSYKLFLYLILLLLLATGINFKRNADKLYGNIGNYFYAKNNAEKAQTFYERAFELGNNQTNLRENYVNSIINSPLTIQSQEKLVNIAQGEKRDMASNNAEYFLYNLKREIHNKYPENYILQAAYNQKIVHWGKSPITYAFKNPYAVNDNLIKGVNSAFNEWERASSCRIKFKQVKLNPDIWVEFIQEDVKSPEYGRKYVVAYTTPIINQNILQNMIIKININDLDGKQYSQNQIYNTALHEIFHALGFMGHSYNKEDIMNMSKDSNALINDKKISLTEADKTTLELLYKIKPDITNAQELEYSYVPYLVIGSNEDVNYSKLREAKNYIRRAPSLSGGYIDMASVLAEQKKYNEATGYLEKALRLADNNDTKYIILYNLAVAYFYQDLYDLSLDYITSAKKISNEAELYLLEAEVYKKQKNFEKAIEKYNYLVSQEPENIDYAINLANVYINKRNYIKAREVLKKYIRHNPTETNNQKLVQYRKLFL